MKPKKLQISKKKSAKSPALRKNSLKQFQNDFFDHIFDQENKNILQDLSYNSIESLERLNIYRNNVLQSYHEILSNIYSLSRKILKDKKFFYLCEEYINFYPSISADLNIYGANFAKFLQKKLKFHKIDYLSKLAEIELIFYQYSFKANIAANFDFTKFAKLSEQKLFSVYFDINPTFKIIRSKYPLYSIWYGKLGKKEPQVIAILKIYDHIILHKLSDLELKFINCINKRQNLYEIYQNLQKNFKKQIDIGKIMNNLIEKAIITNFKVK